MCTLFVTNKLTQPTCLLQCILARLDRKLRKLGFETVGFNMLMLSLLMRIRLLKLLALALIGNPPNSGFKPQLESSPRTKFSYVS